MILFHNSVPGACSFDVNRVLHNCVLGGDNPEAWKRTMTRAGAGGGGGGGRLSPVEWLNESEEASDKEWREAALLALRVTGPSRTGGCENTEKHTHTYSYSSRIYSQLNAPLGLVRAYCTVFKQDLGFKEVLLFSCDNRYLLWGGAIKPCGLFLCSHGGSSLKFPEKQRRRVFFMETLSLWPSSCSHSVYLS